MVFLAGVMELGRSTAAFTCRHLPPPAASWPFPSAPSLDPLLSEMSSIRGHIDMKASSFYIWYTYMIQTLRALNDEFNCAN